MKTLVVTVLSLSGIGWWVLSNLVERKVQLDEEIKDLETVRLTPRRNANVQVVKSERVVFADMVETIRGSDDFFVALESLEGLDRDRLRGLVLECFSLPIENRYPREEAKVLAKSVILAAIAEVDPLWFLEELARSKTGNDEGPGMTSPFGLPAFQNLLRESPEEALAFYERMGEFRYSKESKGGTMNRVYQLVLAHLVSRDPEAAAEHLFAMAEGLRNLPPPEVLELQSVEQSRRFFEALKKQEEDHYLTKGSAMVMAAQKSYEAEGFGILQELWDEFEAGDERRRFLQNSGFGKMLESLNGARDLQRLIAEESARDQKVILANFVSSWAYSNRAGAEEWVRTLSGGEMRDGIVDFLLLGLSEVDQTPKKELVELIENDEMRVKWEERMRE